MQIKGEYTISAPPVKVWEYLTNPEHLQNCIPGCEGLKPIGDDTYEAVLNVGVAGIKGVYTGAVTMENKQRASAYRLVVEGASKIGFINGFCDFNLKENEQNHTGIILDGKLNVGGKLARVGQRIVTSAAKMMIGKFFKGVEKLAKSGAIP